MPAEIQILLLTAIAISFLHTLAGPDHYIPFIALARSKNWSVRKTLLWTAVCGGAHVLSSVVLGLGGAALGWSLSKFISFQSTQGSLAAWLLMIFGLLYCIWGMIKARQNKTHKHFDIDKAGSIHVFEHRHGETVAPRNRYPVTPWVMFLIFLLGPCEPMIPLLYFPAARNSIQGMVALIAIYTLFTVLTMLLMVYLGLFGFSFLKTARLEKHIHVLSGLAILGCGAGMVVMGL